MRDSFVFYRSFAEACRELPPEQFKEAVLAMCDYAMDDEDPEIEGVAKALFLMAKPNIDANKKRYENGKTGGRPKNQTITKPKPNHNQTVTKPKPNHNQTITKPEPNVDVDVDVNVDVDKDVDVNADVSTDVDIKEPNGSVERKSKKREKAEIIETFSKNDILNATIHEFIDFRKQIKAPMSDIALTKMLAKLDKIGKSDHEKIEILNESMANGWKGIFPLDRSKKPREVDWEAL